MVKFVITVCLLLLCKNADGACTFPSDLTGTWLTSTMGTITFTTSQVTIPSVYTYGDLVFGCDTLDGTHYLLRSTTTVTVLGNQLDVVTCFNNVTMLTTGVKYKLQHATAPLNDASGWRLKVLPTGFNLAASTICDESTPYAIGSEDILIKDGSASSAYIQCPDALLGTFSYTYDSGSGDVCSSGSYLDVCTDNTAMTFDLSICSQKVAFSSAGVVNCVYSQTDTSTDTTYVIVYNNDTTTDESTTYRYACLAVSATGAVVNVSESARICQSGQNATYVSSGATLQLTSNYTCVPTTTATPTPTPVASADVTPIVSGTVLLLVLLAIGAVVLFVFLKKKKKKVDPNLSQDQAVKPNSGISSETRPKSRLTVSIMDVESDVSPRDVTVSENEAMTDQTDARPSFEDAETDTDAAEIMRNETKDEDATNNEATDHQTRHNAEDESNDLSAVPDIHVPVITITDTDAAQVDADVELPKIDTGTETSPRDEKTDQDTSRSKKSKSDTPRSKKSKNTPRSKKKK